jgi:hypothetical protein
MKKEKYFCDFCKKELTKKNQPKKQMKKRIEEQQKRLEELYEKYSTEDFLLKEEKK